MFFNKKSKEPEHVDVLGRPFRCLACGYDRFWLGRAQLNTPLATFFNFDWANRTAAHITCAQCGHMSWFQNV